MKSTIIPLVMLFAGCLAQRGSYAGLSPIGYPAYETPQPAASDGLADRFGEVGSTTTIRLPVEARGDVELFNRLRKLPVDQQPFWVLNWLALEANRDNPQSYPQKPNDFIDSKSNTVI